MGYYNYVDRAPPLECTNCSKEIEGTALMVQGKPYCSKKCILKGKLCCKCNTPMKNDETICSTCGARIILRQKRK